MAIKAYQLLLVTVFLAKHEYVSVKDGKDLKDLLIYQVWENKAEKCDCYFTRYFEVFSDSTTRLFRISTDVASHITGHKLDASEAMKIAAQMAMFSNIMEVIVAGAFSDAETINKIETDIKIKTDM